MDFQATVRQRGDEKLARQVGMYLCHKCSGKNFGKLVVCSGGGETAIAAARHLLSSGISLASLT